MAEPAEPPPDMTDKEESWLTDEEEDSGSATRDYRAVEQRNVSGQSREEAQCNGKDEEDHGSSCEKVEHWSDIETLVKNYFLSDSDDIEEKTEIILEAIMAKRSDKCREKGNKLFKEKKVGF